MTRYTVQQRKRATDRIDLIDDIVVLKDGYSWGAFWLGPLWLINQGAFAAGFVDLALSVVFANLMLADSGFISVLGLGSLKPEESTNYSFGVVTHPLEDVTATLDVYQIELTDRIFGSSTLFGSVIWAASLPLGRSRRMAVCHLESSNAAVFQSVCSRRAS